MEYPYSIAIDFDGTVTDVDVIDEILRSFAPPEWQAVETLWERGVIGSRECLEMQMSLVDRRLDEILRLVDGFSIDPSFGPFCRFLRNNHIPFAIVSDGFQVFIERLLARAGLKNIPILANILTEEKGALKTVFPYSDPGCRSANCKCNAVSELSRGRALMVVGDGRSDFCLADKASHTYAKKKLAAYCRENLISHTCFNMFSEIHADLQTRIRQIPSLLFAPGKD